MTIRASEMPVICAYCGQPTTKPTRDHVVPSTLWGGKGSRPAHPAVVPACDNCRSLDKDAEYFRDCLVVMMDKDSHPIAGKLLEGPISRNFVRNQRALADVTNNIRLAPRYSAGGVIVGSGWAFQIDRPRFNRTIEKIVRGLFFHSSNIPLPDTHEVKVSRGNSFWEDQGFQNLFAAMTPPVGCGDDVFSCRATRDITDPFVTAWLLIFYNQMGFFAWTQAKELVETA